MLARFVVLLGLPNTVLVDGDMIELVKNEYASQFGYWVVDQDRPAGKRVCVVWSMVRFLDAVFVPDWANLIFEGMSH